MFFQESEVIARDHPDLGQVVQQIDEQLSGISSSAPLRPADFACVLGAEENQVASVFELLAQGGVLLADEMVECERCQNLMPENDFCQAIEDEDDFECTGCGQAFSQYSEPILVYRLAPQLLPRLQAAAKPLAAQISEIFDVHLSEESLCERAQLVLVAMIELGAIDSDTRKSTADIAAKALGTGSDPNALKGVMADLKTRQLVASKTGRGGGCWLTESGCVRGEKLRQP